MAFRRAVAARRWVSTWHEKARPEVVKGRAFLTPNGAGEPQTGVAGARSADMMGTKRKDSRLVSKLGQSAAN
jgi:hypothetical protein